MFYYETSEPFRNSYKTWIILFQFIVASGNSKYALILVPLLGYMVLILPLLFMGGFFLILYFIFRSTTLLGVADMCAYLCVSRGIMWHHRAFCFVRSPILAILVFPFPCYIALASFLHSTLHKNAVLRKRQSTK